MSPSMRLFIKIGDINFNVQFGRAVIQYGAVSARGEEVYIEQSHGLENTREVFVDAVNVRGVGFVGRHHGILISRHCDALL